MKNFGREWTVEYFDGDTWQPKCGRKTYRAAVIARNRYFGSDSGDYPLHYRIVKSA